MDNQKQPNDAETLAGLKNREDSAYSILYKFYYPSVEKFIVSNNGSVDDAKDIFQETIIVLLEKVPMDDFELTSSLKTYIYSISSNLWLKRLREAKRITNVEVKEVFEQLHGSSSDQNTHTQQQTKKVNTLMAKISEHCRKLLDMIFFRKKKMSEIAEEQGYSNMHSAQNQKYKCIQQLKKEVDKK
ncbi:MAG: sigma-70 family RNA polymerase sigma factor [Patescibacteria group bacterium]|nr:sigma-70 family RNA polymerase sigma factor [Patescibacteria group bacterium]